MATPQDLDQDLPGRGVAHGFEIGLTPVVLGAIGWIIDRAAGTRPVFTVIFVVFGVVGLGLRYYYAFKQLAQENRHTPTPMVRRRRSNLGQR